MEVGPSWRLPKRYPGAYVFLVRTRVLVGQYQYDQLFRLEECQSFCHPHHQWSYQFLLPAHRQIRSIFVPMSFSKRFRLNMAKIFLATRSRTASCCFNATRFFWSKNFAGFFARKRLFFLTLISTWFLDGRGNFDLDERLVILPKRGTLVFLNNAVLHTDGPLLLDKVLPM